MKLLLLRLSFLLVFCAFLKNSQQAQCDVNGCRNLKLTTTTTTINFNPLQNCTLVIGNQSFEELLITGLTPGAVHQVFLKCANCCKEITTKPEVVRNLTFTEITTSSVSLSWTEPEGNSSFYRVEWTDGRENGSHNVNTTSTNITALIAGVQYQITITAVADDDLTDGQSTTVSQYTSPGTIEAPSVSQTTSSISLNWTKPAGEVFKYRVEWHSGGEVMTQTTHYTSAVLPDLIPGSNYTLKVIAIAQDNRTEGAPHIFSAVTSPGTIEAPSVSQTTSSISLNWTKPAGEVFKYRVEWHNGGEVMIQTTHYTSAVLPDLIPGSNYTLKVTAIAQDNRTEGAPHIFSAVTKPEVVRNLTVTEVTTSSVSLNWAEPEGNATSYTVQWTAGADALSNITTNDTSIIITELLAGSQYNITVAAVAGYASNEGASSLVTTFTRPEKPGNIQVTAKGTDNLNIDWTLPSGKVDHYVVNISNEEVRFLSSNTTGLTTVSFSPLYPGRIYIITVTAVAGHFSNTSDQSTLATVPTPPHAIIINQRATTSLRLEWATPALMEGALDISYHITYQREGGGVQNKSSIVNNTELSSLSSGTSYNVTVETVGPQNLRSTVIHNSTYTLPNPVLNVTASPESTTSVKVEWSDPQGVQVYYTYRIQTNNTAGMPVNPITVSTDSTVVTGLEPGTGYTFTVTTVAAPGSDSTTEQAFSYTQPKAVTNLTVVDLNTTAIRLTWLRQSDYKPSYSYQVSVLRGAEVVHSDSTQTETYTFVSLTPGESYTFRVLTVVEEVKSAVESTSSYTGPGAVSDLAAAGTTTNMSVSWTAAAGQVDSYSVLLYRGTLQEGNHTGLSNTTLTVLFQGLKPGTLYRVQVVTKSGPLFDNSTTSNATFPNPPGSIMVESQTTDALNMSWALPEHMEPGQYNFTVFSLNKEFLITNNWILLPQLQSGTAYNVSVVTVGALGYQSTVVMTQNYTRPHSVSMLREAGISPTTVTLLWDQPESKPGYSYLVQTTNSEDSSIIYLLVFNTTYTITGLLSGSNYTFTVTTQTADGTKATPVTVSYFTSPYKITGLEASTLNTTAVHLNWTRPLQYKNGYKYWIEITGCGSRNKTVAEEEAEISELTPGTNCTFCVSVMAEDGTEGESYCTSQYTKPEMVQPMISSSGSNSSVLVWWSAPFGNVEQYVVHLNSTSQDFPSVELNSTSTSFLFDSLSAGREYSAKVTTSSGPFTASSGFITNATFPNPPGPIEILMKTTSSIHIKWEEAPLMANASFQYLVTKMSSQGTENTTNTSHTFSSLLSGTSYNISVATVGPMDFKSEEVWSHMVTTRPNSVKSLEAVEKENNITLKWVKPDDYKESYRYYLTWGNSGGPISHNETTETEELHISGLVPGSSYNFSVTTETSDRTQGAPESISTCTDASPVTNIKCEGPDGTEAKVSLSWTKPNGLNSGFRLTVENHNKTTIYLPNTCNPNCGHTVSNLNYSTQYKLTLETQSCGEPSTPVTLTCMTGITNPPIPPNYVSLVKVTETEHNMFSIQIDPSLLNAINGPITQVGVLVTNNINAVDPSNLKQYLVNTYQEWTRQATSVYLATVKDNLIQSRSGGNQLVINIGDATKWNGYSNGVLTANEQYHYAIVLFTNLTLQSDGLVSTEFSLASTTVFFSAVKLPQSPVVIGIAVGATLGIFCVLLIITIGFIIYWRRLNNKESSDIQIQTLRAKVNLAVTVDDYEAYYRKQKADSNCGFAEEFEDLKPVGTAQAKSSALALENKPKNRYNNVLPYDSSRVKLSVLGSPFDDYINANYIPGYNSRKEFIAAQGPLPATVNEFWRMIWEKNVQTLVMLTRCNEQGRVKCERYWPSDTKHFGNITVTTTSEIPLEDWTIRDFDIKNVKTAETRSVRHFHFTAWPDHGVPETTELLINFRHLVREHMDQYSRHSPTVVHCSAGVGRTGTFIAIDRLIFQIERESIVDVYGIIHDLRMHRSLMVQTEDQYVFLNQCAMDIIRSRTGTNVDLIYQNTAALSIYENVEPRKGLPKNGYHNA
ncbi:receptor-type tyrosine-protein phosphatase eta-like [Centroberyx affinis]|uniref:receptor-type tyrosine-protein phosphatase eta-like n=1 Tax=Centroberyx affinis TaxID=166261 RepID=UPI003A5C4216